MPRSALQLHVVERLLAHFAFIERAGFFQQAIGQRAFAVVDVSNDREIANMFAVGVRHEIFRRVILVRGLLLACPAVPLARLGQPVATVSRRFARGNDRYSKRFTSFVISDNRAAPIRRRR